MTAINGPHFDPQPPTARFRSFCQRLRFSDHAETVLECREPATAQPDQVLVILPAMAVEASYYAPLADALAQRGFAVVMLDLRGQGSSTLRAASRHDFGYREIIAEELPATLNWARGRWPGTPVGLIGHSLGGQLAVQALARATVSVDRLILVGSGTNFRRNWSGLDGLWYGALIQLIRACSVLPWYPGHLIGFGGQQANRFMRDWLHAARTGDYRPEGLDEMTHRVDLGGLRVLVMPIVGDVIAPASAAAHLIGKISSARFDWCPVQLPQKGRWARHFAWVRSLVPQVPDRMAGWLRDGTLPVAGAEATDTARSRLVEAADCR